MKAQLVTIAFLAIPFSLQSCASSRFERGVCVIPGHTELPAPPANVQDLHALMAEGGQARKRDHEHWFQLDKDTILLCRHPRSRSIPPGCATSKLEFRNTGLRWEMSPLEITICQALRREALALHAADNPRDTL